MARELHDTLAQGLAGIILQLEAIDSRISSGQTEQVQTIIHQAMARARATLAESRQVIDHLRKDTSSSQDDLSSVIKEEVDHFSTSTGIPVTLRLDTQAFIPFPQRDCACRAVAEALLNITRHAEASQVWINIVASTDLLSIEIHDNGTGFNRQTRLVRLALWVVGIARTNVCLEVPGSEQRSLKAQISRFAYPLKLRLKMIEQENQSGC
jgi:NarL family two-component system sensor histidine kinase YdfH